MNAECRVSKEELEHDIRQQELEKERELEVLGVEECAKDMLEYGMVWSKNHRREDGKSVEIHCTFSDAVVRMLEEMGDEADGVLQDFYRSNPHHPLSKLLLKAAIVDLGDFYGVDISSDEAEDLV